MANDPITDAARRAATNIIQDVCELLNDYIQDAPDILAVSVEDLQVILDRNLNAFAAAAVAEERALIARWIEREYPRSPEFLLVAMAISSGDHLREESRAKETE